MIRTEGRGPGLPETKPVSLSNDPPRRGGPGPDSRANGSFPKGARRLSEKSPAGHPPPHRRDGISWERGRPARILFLWPPPSFGRRRASVRCCWQPPCGREQQRPGRRRAMAPLPVDPSGGDGRGCARLGAGGTPALPGSLHPMTSSHQGHQIAEASWCRLSLKQVHLSSGLFVFIRVHWWFVFIKRSAVFPRMIPTAPPGRHLLGARASRPHPVPLAAAELQCDAAGSHPVGGNSIGQAEGEPWRRCRLIQVGEMAEAVPGLVRAGRPRSQEALIP